MRRVVFAILQRHGIYLCLYLFIYLFTADIPAAGACWEQRDLNKRAARHLQMHTHEDKTRVVISGVSTRSI